MLMRLFGIGRTSGATENDRPTAWPGVGYGSWPTISTRTSSNGCLNARSTFSPAGRYVRPSATSARRNSPIAAIRSATGSSASAQPASMTSFRGRAMPPEGNQPERAAKSRSTCGPSVEPAQPRLVDLGVLHVLVHDRQPRVRRHLVALADLRRDTEGHPARRDVAVEGHHRARAEDRALLHHGTVEQHRSGRDEA